MAVLNRRRLLAASCSLLTFAAAELSFAATPTVEDALKLTPVKKQGKDEVEYDQPSAAEIPQCTIKPEKIDGQTGWVVRGPAGMILRRFVDTNADNVVDLWCYYQGGIEVYRDIDKNYNGKADQYRWLNTGGTRWALDENEDGRIDAWKAISAEEVSAELVAALAAQDAARFERLLPTAAEIKSLGLGPSKESELSAKVKAAGPAFADLMRRQKEVGANTHWVQFGATRPGVVPAGTEGSTKDLIVYENIAAMTETGNDHGQVALGTLIRVGEAWRVIDVPAIAADSVANAGASGFFFQTALINRGGAPDGLAGSPEGASQELLVELEKLEQAAAKAASPDEQQKLESQRADLVLRLAEASTKPEDRAQWLRQYADMLSAAAQAGESTAGVDRLKELYEKLTKDPADKELAGYVKFRYLTAWYGASVQAQDADFEKIQKQWVESLEQFVGEHPQSSDADEAMLQLAIAQEFAGQEEEASKWYGRIVSDFPQAPSAAKAAGAKRRLDSVGKILQLQGKSTTGQAVDLSKYRGKVVLVHYWASWSEPCKADLAQLKELQGRYGRNGFELIGVSLDHNATDLANFLKTNRLPWPQLYEQGGLDSRLANELGILTLPTMILLDKQGKVINRNLHVTELERELKAALR